MLNKDTLQGIREQLDRGGATQYVYVLADHSGLPGLSQALRTFGIKWTNLFGDDKRPELLQASPLLFELPATAQMSRWLEENANFSHSVLLIASPLRMTALANRLAARCEGILSDDIRVTLRYFDTRVFPELLKVLPGENRAAWLGCATAWFFPKRDGYLEQVNSRFQPEECLASPMALNDEQMNALVRASEPDQVADLLAQYTPSQFYAIPEQKRHGFVQHMISRASSIGINAPRDYAIYSGLMLIKGAEFDESQQWAKIRERISNGETTLSGAIELLEQGAV